MLNWTNRCKFLRLSIFIVIICLSLQFQNSSFSVYASTVDDVRELIGRQRIDESFTPEEVRDITAKYLQAERNNVIAEMFARGQNIAMTDDTDKIQLISAINTKKRELDELFKSGADINIVLEKKTELDSLVTKKDKLREEGVQIDVEFTPNSWTQQYAEVQKMINSMEHGIDIGDVGITLKPPIESQFLITSPFGSRIDPINHTQSWHSGLDLNAELGESILALWSGVVSDAYSDDPIGGNVVEISHGDGLITKYLHLSEIAVKPGDIIKQYQVIGKAGSTGRSTGPHLHLEVYVDGVLTNPILLFGKHGINALQTYVSTHPGAYAEAPKLIAEIKDAPEKNQDKQSGSNVSQEPIYKRDTPTNVDIISTLPDNSKPPNPGILTNGPKNVIKADNETNSLDKSKVGGGLWSQRAESYGQ